MSGYKYNEVLKQKKEGDEFYSFQMPEEFHIWTQEHKWKHNAFKNYNMRISTISVSGSLETSKKEVKYNKRSPLPLDCGVDMDKGRYALTTTKKASFGPFNADSAVEVNEILGELTEKYGITVWKIQTVRVYIPDGRELHFKIHSPNSIETSLFFYELKDGNREELFLNVGLNEQQNLTSATHLKLAHCVLVKDEELNPACKIKNMEKKKPAKGKTTTKWIHLN